MKELPRLIQQAKEEEPNPATVLLSGWTNDHEQVFGDHLDSHSSNGGSARAAQPSRVFRKRRTVMSLHDWGLGRIVAWTMSSDCTDE
jgi:hypothetical protein